MKTEPIIEQAKHQGRIYVSLHPEHVNKNAMAQVQKIKNVFAWQVQDGEEYEVVTYANDLVETTNIAHPGDWVVYNIGNGVGDTLDEQLASCDQKVIKADLFPLLYGKSDEDANTDQRGTIFEYIGRPVYIARVPFAFYHNAPWGERQYIDAGGYMVYNPNTHEWYGTAGAHNRTPGQLENTYKLIKNDPIIDNDHLVKDDPKTISKTFRMVIAADRSPLPGIQFNGPDLQRAYEEAGLSTVGMEKYF